MKKELFTIVFMVSLILIVGCAEQMTDEELNSELDQLSEEELIEVLGEDETALAGEASKPSQIKTVRLRRSMIRVKEPLVCSDNGKLLTFSRGDWSKSIPKFFCSNDNSGERVCNTIGDGFTSTLETCEYGCEEGKCNICTSETLSYFVADVGAKNSTGYFNYECYPDYYKRYEGHFLTATNQPISVLPKTCGNFDILVIFFDNETNRDLLLENDYIPIEIKEQLSTDLNEGLVNLFESYTPETVFESLSVRPTITFEFDVQIVDFRDPPDYYPRWSPHQNWRFMADASDFSGYDAVLFLEYINGQIIGTGIRPWPTVSSINLYLYDTNTRMFVLDPMWTSPGLFYNELFRRNVPIMPAEYIPGPEAYETIGPTTYDRTPFFNPRTGEAIDLRSADIGSRFLGWHDSDGDGIIDCEDRDITPSAENTDGDFLPDFMDPDLSVNHRSIFLNPR